MLKTITIFIWKNSPLWLKLSAAISVLPLVVVLYYKAWHISDIKSYVDPIQERNERQFKAIIKQNSHQIKLLREDFREIKQQNSMMFQYMLNNSRTVPTP